MMSVNSDQDLSSLLCSVSASSPHEGNHLFFDQPLLAYVSRGRKQACSEQSVSGSQSKQGKVEDFSFVTSSAFSQLSGVLAAFSFRVLIPLSLEALAALSAEV